MIRHLLTALIPVLAVCMTANAGTGVTLTDCTGAPGSEITVGVALENEPGVVAMQLSLPMPEGLEYVEGSCTAVGNRLKGHSISAAVNGGRLVVLVYSTALTEIGAGSGEVLSFGLRLGNEPGAYALTPDLRLSDAAGNAVDAAVSSGTVTVAAPKIATVCDSVDFGRCAIRGTYRRTMSLANTGNRPLNIDAVTPSDPTLSVNPSALTIEPGAAGTIAIDYAPTVRARQFNATLTVSSDAVNGKATVRIMAIPYSVNELHMEPAQCSSGEEVTVSARMNNMEPITAADFRMELPQGFEYVEGSAAPASRAANHSVSGATDGGRLRIVMFHPANEAVEGNDGELLTFRLKAVTNRGSYALTPMEVKLSNRDGENMTSASYGSYLSISAPSLGCADALAMEAAPVTSGARGVLAVDNRGNAPLVIDRALFLADGYTMEEPLPLTVEPNQSAALTVRYDAPSAGPFSTTLNLYSNDPDSPMRSVRVSGSLYEPNEIALSGEPNDDHDAYTLHVDLSNYTGIAALQADIEWLGNMTAATSDMLTTDRSAAHSKEVAALEPGRHRVILFSLSNATFTGNEGRLFDLAFHGTGFIGSRLAVSNIRLSGKDGKDYTTPGSSPLYLDIDPVLAREITLDRTSETADEGNRFTLTATVLPTNTTNKKVEWSSTDEKVATVDDDGNVEVKSGGICSIQARTTDGSGLIAECSLSAVAAIDGIGADMPDSVDVYDLSGVLLRKGVSKSDLSTLSPGIYIINGRKTAIR